MPNLHFEAPGFCFVLRMAWTDGPLKHLVQLINIMNSFSLITLVKLLKANFFYLISVLLSLPTFDGGESGRVLRPRLAVAPDDSERTTTVRPSISSGKLRGLQTFRLVYVVTSP